MIIKSLEDRSNFGEIILSTIDMSLVYFHPFLDDYLFTPDGKVFSLKTNKFLKQQLNSNGYLGVNIEKPGVGRRFCLTHRLIAETFFSYLGKDNYFYEVNHIDGNKQNNNVYNLEWLTRKENLDHSKKLRLTNPKSGEQNPNSKLTNNQIKDMIELVDLGFKIKDVCESYNVNRSFLYTKRARSLKNV